MNTNGIPGPEETRWVTIPKTPETYSYDADGNLTADGSWTYTWDGENRLFAMESTSSLPAAAQKTRLEFYYDYLSRRSVKLRYKPSGGGTGGTGGTTDSVTVTQLDIKDGGASTDMKVDDSSPGTQVNFASGTYPLPVGWALSYTSKFVWDGWNLIAELNGNDAKVRTCAWGLDLSGSEQGAGGIGGLAFEYLAATNATHHAYFDGNGNLTSLRDDTGAISAGYEYGPFGETLTIRGSAAALAANAYRFSTKYSDAETGLLYYGYRYYNPGTGRWLNRDPIGTGDGPGTYLLTANDAIGSTDTLGLWKRTDTWSGGWGNYYGHAQAECNDTLGGLASLITNNSADAWVLGIDLDLGLTSSVEEGKTVSVDSILYEYEKRLRRLVVRSTNTFNAPFGSTGGGLTETSIPSFFGGRAPYAPDCGWAIKILFAKATLDTLNRGEYDALFATSAPPTKTTSVGSAAQINVGDRTIIKNNIFYGGGPWKAENVVKTGIDSYWGFPAKKSKSELNWKTDLLTALVDADGTNGSRMKANPNGLPWTISDIPGLDPSFVQFIDVATVGQRVFDHRTEEP